MQTVCSSSSIFGCTEEFKYSRDLDHCRHRIIYDTLPARPHFSVITKQTKCVSLALGKNPVWIWSGVGFPHWSFFVVFFKLWKFRYSAL